MEQPEPSAQLSVAIVQSNYIPWKGYFDLIAAADRFILFDDMQYTRRDWRNRNRIKTAQGLQWLTVPVAAKGRYLQKIRETRIQQSGWAADHWEQVRHAYRRAPFFERYRERFEALYLGTEEALLSRVNRRFIDAICDILDIDTEIGWSMDYSLVDGRTERLVGLCQSAGASRYLSGPAARDYIDPALFEAAGIELEYIDYSGYPEYPQLHGPFEHGVSVIDLIFNAGPDARAYMLCGAAQ